MVLCVIAHSVYPQSPLPLYTIAYWSIYTDADTDTQHVDKRCHLNDKTSTLWTIFIVSRKSCWHVYSLSVLSLHLTIKL